MSGCRFPDASSAFGLWPGTVIPQSNGLAVTTLCSTVLSCVGPNSSVSRTPPSLLLTKLSLTSDHATPIRWMPSPQSPGISPNALHSGYGEVLVGGMPPVLLPTTWLL